jgi:hypothetical protein
LIFAFDTKKKVILLSCLLLFSIYYIEFKTSWELCSKSEMRRILKQKLDNKNNLVLFNFNMTRIYFLIHTYSSSLSYVIEFFNLYFNLF